MNKTFFWHNTCPQNHQDTLTCFGTTETQKVDPYYTVYNQHGDWYCRLWGGQSRGRSFHDGEWATMCLHFGQYWDYDTTFRFNGQTRDIGYHGRQGRKEVEKDEERRVCDDLCREMLVCSLSIGGRGQSDNDWAPFCEDKS